MSRGLAVVTGATAGIGREFGEQLAARGYDLLLVARDRDRLNQAAAGLSAAHGIRAEPLSVDLSHDDAVTRLAGRLSSSPDLRLLVNNAGFGTRGVLLRANPTQQEAMLRVHTLAPLRLTLAALPVLARERRGAVVNVSSVASLIYSPGNVNYCATKAYLTTFTEGLAAELRGTGVQAQALCPGFTRTEFHQRMGGGREGIPGFMWMSTREVVRISLRALDRNGPVVCVPGLRYQLLVALIRLTPRRLLGRIARMRQEL